MGHNTQTSWAWSMLLALAMLLSNASGASLAISYCSYDNTGSNNAAMYSQFQSTGLCGDHCQGSFAYAVVQGNECWCSNYTPADQEDTYSCNTDCPGTGDEWCGNTQEGLFGYFLLPAGHPLGTAGSGGSSSKASSTAAPPSPSSTYVAPSSTYVPPSSTYVAPSSTYVPPSSSPSPTYAPSSTHPASSSHSSSPSPTSSPSVITSVMTVTGQVKTILVTPSASADPNLGQVSAKNHGVSSGEVAGIVVGVAIGLGAVIGGLVWFCLRRKHRRRIENMSEDGSFVAERAGGSANGNVPSRQVSQMSSAGLLNKTPRLQTNGLAAGLGLASAGTTTSNGDRRSVATDQRLNPWALYQQEDRASNVSLQDNTDYSRQLRVANPDM